jgi:hypothetical protein
MLNTKSKLYICSPTLTYEILHQPTPKSILLIGAPKGIAMVEEYLKHGWSVVGTVRG